MAALRIPTPGRRFVISVPYVWLVVFFFLPFLILLYISFVDMGNDITRSSRSGIRRRAC